MNPKNNLPMLVFLLAVALTGCEKCDTEPNVPDPSLGSATESIPSPKIGEQETVEPPSNEEPTIVREAPSLEGAFEAPEDAVTSEGRFADLMEQGLSEHLPPTGLAFASGGVDQPTTRVVVASDGTVQWARGQGQYWDKLDRRGEAELGESEIKKLSELIQRAWTDQELEYPATAANRGEVLIVRDGDTARVIEASQLPKELLPLRELLLGLVQPAQP